MRTGCRACRRQRFISASPRSVSTPTGLLYTFLAFWYFVGIVIALRIVRSPVGAILRAIRDNPLRAAAVGHNIHGYKLTAFVIAAAYAGFAGGLLGVMQGFMPPDAFMFDTSGQLVMQTAIGGAGTLFGPLVGAIVWLYLQDFLQTTLNLGASWKLVLGRRLRAAGMLPAARPDRRHQRSLRLCCRAQARDAEPETEEPVIGHDRGRRAKGRAGVARPRTVAAPMPARDHAGGSYSGSDSCRRRGVTKRYGGLVANSDIDFTVYPGELRGVIGPNGAGKTTFFKMLTCEIQPTSGTIVFEGHDITGMDVTDVCQLGLTKSYQVNQLFNRLTVRENLTIAALAELRGKFRLDMLRNLSGISGLEGAGGAHARTGQSRGTHRHAGFASLPMARSGGSRSVLRSPPAHACCCSTSRSPGMSPRERVETVKLLKSISRGRTMIVIDHDMDSLFELVGRVTVLQEGRVLVEGTPGEIKGNAAVQEAYLGGIMAA